MESPRDRGSSPSRDTSTAGRSFALRVSISCMSPLTREQVKLQQGHQSDDTVVFNFGVVGVRCGGFTAVNAGTGWTAFGVEGQPAGR